jgi:ribosomal protein S18 acetylase RimI-like enzyme
MMETEIRPARKDDCGAIARLYSISSDGVADYVWSCIAEPGQSLLEVGRKRYEREESQFSYRNCRVVTAGDDVVGMLVAFPMDEGPVAADPDPDPVLAPYSRLEDPGSYYICGVALLPEYRGQGIGTRLMALAEEEARERGLPRLSLIVFERNEGALRLYERLGYVETARATVVPHPLIRMSGDAILMVRSLAP